MGWGGGTHRSWPGGRGGRRRALIPGRVSLPLAGQALRGVQVVGGGAKARGRSKGFGPGGTGPGMEQIVVFLLFLTCRNCLEYREGLAWRGKGSGGGSKGFGSGGGRW